MKRFAIAAAICLLSACGGKDSSNSITNPGSAAAAKTFTYGSPSGSTSLSQTTALSTQLSGLVGAQGSLTSSSAQAAGDFSTTTDALIGGYATPVAAAFPQLESALTAVRGNGPTAYVAGVGSTGVFDNPSCVKEGTGSVSFDKCTLTSSDSTVKVTVDGSFAATATSAKWNLTLDVTASGSSAGHSGSATGHYGTSGDVTTSTAGDVVTVNGDLREELAMDWTIDGKSDGFDVSEQLLLTGVTYDKVNACVTGGTLEAKRVWVKRPSGESATSLPSKGAKVTWQSCGTGSIAFSTN